MVEASEASAVLKGPIKNQFHRDSVYPSGGDVAMATVRSRVKNKQKQRQRKTERAQRTRRKAKALNAKGADGKKNFAKAGMREFSGFIFELAGGEVGKEENERAQVERRARSAGTSLRIQRMDRGRRDERVERFFTTIGAFQKNFCNCIFCIAR